ncbi:MAG TPA: DUF3500 domain-containing protein [Burkholderiales bacterium]|nr:DUF3500 domain-containing protein [Burkholderiales bacterium]
MQSRILIGLLGACLALGAAAQDKPHPSAAAAAKMRVSAERLLAALPEQSREQALRPFEDRDRTDWHYTPRSRNGLALKEMDQTGREATHALLRTALSAAGYRKAVNIIELEIVLREIETFGWMRDPERYHLTVYGAPDAAKAWGWRFEGHHLSLNFTLAGDRLAAGTPSFFGANPATVANGPRMGLRALGEEHDAGWALLESLTEAQRREAVFEARTYGDIVTGNRDPVAPLDAVGIPGAKLDARQRTALWKLIETYAGSFEPGLARARLERAQQGGVEAIRFGWAGSTRRGKPHYYRVQGKLFLIEYDASQNDGNHIHTVWRDFSGDFGRDLLREHYSLARGTSHRH